MTITKQDVKDNLDFIKKVLAEIDTEWVEINNQNCPTLKKYGVQPFEIMKYKMRNAKGEVWDTISFADATKEAETLGYRLPHWREISSLMEHYVHTKKHPNMHDKAFLGIEELSYDEHVYCEFLEGPGGVAAIRGGDWSNDSSDGPFALHLYDAPSSVYTPVGFRCVRSLTREEAI